MVGEIINIYEINNITWENKDPHRVSDFAICYHNMRLVVWAWVQLSSVCTHVNMCIRLSLSIARVMLGYSYCCHIFCFLCSRVYLLSFRPTIRLVIQIYSNLGLIVTFFRERNKFLSLRQIIGKYQPNLYVQFDLRDRQQTRTDQAVHPPSPNILFILEMTEIVLIAKSLIRF